MRLTRWLVPALVSLGLLGLGGLVALTPSSADPVSKCSALNRSVRNWVHPTRNVSVLTFNTARFQRLRQQGYVDRGVIFKAGSKNSRLTPVRVMYAKKTKDRIYTTSKTEIAALKRKGYRDNGTGFHVYTRPDSCLTPVYQFRKQNLHRYAVTADDRAQLRDSGWVEQGAVFYVGKYAGATPTPTLTPTPSPTPTQTPSATATPPPGNGEFPSAANTGVRPGTKLTKITGRVIIWNAGQVLENVEINGCVSLAPGADNVIIRNVLIKTPDCRFMLLNDEGAKNLQVIDTEFDGMNNGQGDSAVGGYNYTLTRVNIHNTFDGAKLGSNVTIQDSYIHDLIVTDDSHNDGLQGLDGTNIVIRRNTIIAPDGSTSAIILGVNGNDSWRLNNILIDNNLLGGGAWTVYGGYQEGVDPLDRVSNIRITNNKFTTRIFPKGGFYGPITSVDPPAVTTSGNVWYDGENKGGRVY